MVQAVAFTTALILAIYTFWHRERYLPRAVEAAAARLPLAHPLRKECYGLITRNDEAVMVAVGSDEANPGASREVSAATTVASASIARRRKRGAPSSD